MNLFPQRPDQHVLDSKASKYLKAKLPDEWISDPISSDYGIDFSVNIVNKGNVLGPNFSIQLKGKQDISGKAKATTQLKKSTLNYWNNRFEPILVVIYCDTDKKAYYRWFDKNEFDLTSSQSEFTFNINKYNDLDTIDWHHIKQEILELFTLKHRLYHLYSASLSRLNNLEFEHIWSVYTSGKFEDTIEYCKAKIKEEENILWHAIISHAYYITYQYKIGLFHVQKALSMIYLESDESIKKELYPDLKMKHASILAELGRTSGNEFYLFEAFNIWIALIETEQRIDSNLFYNFANTCLLLNKLDLAEVYFLRALNFDKNNPQAWTNLADVYGLIGNFKKELDCYKKAIKIDQSLKNALIGEGIALYHLKEYKKSLKILLELKEYEKEWRINYNDYYYYLSEVYDKLCQPDKSIEVAEEGLFYDPGNVKIINKLCELYSSHWESSEIIKGKAKKLYLMRLQVFTDDLRTIGELVNIKISDGFSVKEIAEFVKSHISIEQEMTDEDIVTALTKKRSKLSG